MIKRIIKSGKYHTKKFFFDRFAIPKVRQENISKALFKRLLPDSPVIIDCGAHDGNDTIALADLFPKGIVHAFEPVPALFERLKKRCSKNFNVRFYNCALSDKDGIMDFFISEGESDASSSLLEPKEHLKDHPTTQFNNVLKVETLTLDSWAHQNQINKVDLLWLDMQGFEFNMLFESKDILNTVSVIHTEVSTKETYKNVKQYDELRNFLLLKGFSVYIEAIPKSADMGNVLFVKKCK